MNLPTLRTIIIAAILALLFPLPLSAQAARAPKPLVILVESNPWNIVIGSDSPTFALYDDGQAIYWAGDGYKSVTLDKDELAGLVAKLDIGSLAGLAKYYDAAEATDQPTEKLVVYAGDKASIIQVYGSLKARDTQSKVPAKIVAVYDILRFFRHAGVKDWLPEKIEVMIWPYEYAPGASIVWPKNWPGLHDAATVKRGDSYSIFVPSADYGAVRHFLDTEKEKGAVEIGGKKWAASIRMPFPGERSWMGRSGE